MFRQANIKNTENVLLENFNTSKDWFMYMNLYGEFKLKQG